MLLGKLKDADMSFEKENIKKSLIKEVVLV